MNIAVIDQVFGRAPAFLSRSKPMQKSGVGLYALHGSLLLSLTRENIET